MNVLYETEQLKIEHEYESTYLTDKNSGDILLDDDFYGDPKCGLIDPQNKWAIIGGEHLVLWTPLTTKVIEDEDLRWIHELRLKNENTVEILIDPWSSKSSIWEVNTSTFEYAKLRDFTNYQGKEYTEEIYW
ncbi:hypothetical protein E1176_18585 [Fulvivirga sp. RKSG066]|uniref:hypothetical protein n=1 Tax=Fulvivirga aurantia TaxID=2529383 RepID=UPI0012BC943F|nr:hypothetical protein [Fulvivirga aurantia]MTI23044.1 hypothetical protein [Fulvivirga aurantia]